MEIATDSDSGYHDFRDGSHVVLDILAPKTDAAAYTPPSEGGAVKPTVTKIEAGASASQAKTITDAAARLAKEPEAAKTEAKPADPKAASAKAETTKAADAKPEIKAPDAKDETPPAPPPNVVGQLTRNGASISFRGASAAAVFVRGMTAWVVLENAPVPDAAALRKSLGSFAASVEASADSNNGPGLSVLRIGLAAPAKIASHADAAGLRVTIGDDTIQDAATIGFARNQADPKRTSLTTTLPRADQSFAITDPASGDTLTIVPAGAGFGVPAQKIFADFAALPSAQGLVIAPYADDLAVTVTQARVAIARPGGLALTRHRRRW